MVADRGENSETARKQHSASLHYNESDIDVFRWRCFVQPTKSKLGVLYLRGIYDLCLTCGL